MLIPKWLELLCLKLDNKIKNLISEVLCRFIDFPKEKHFDVPFFAQDAEAESRFGSSYPLEKRDFELWVDSACGMFCLKMFLAKMRPEVLPISVIDLAKEAMDYGAYFIGTDRKLSALKYAPFSTFIKHKFNINSEVCSILTHRRIKYELSKGNLVIASVHWDIKHIHTPLLNPPFKGGHLVLVVGYSEFEKSFYINNPSGLKEISDKDAKISYSDFSKFFAGRGIILH